MRTVLIVFTDPHLAYSPSTLNLFYRLKKEGVYTLLLSEPPNNKYSSRRINDPGIVYVKENETFYTRAITILQKIAWRITRNNMFLKTQRAKNYIKAIKRNQSDIVIAVDVFALWCVQQTGIKAHFLSLELPEKGIDYMAFGYFKNINLNNILSVITQSHTRYEYLFAGMDIPMFILPNSPSYVQFKPNIKARDKHNLVYCGSAVINFGILSILDFLKKYEEYTLTIIGGIPSGVMAKIKNHYNHLIVSKRLIIDNKYYDTDSLARHLSAFWCGFVFYDIYNFSSMRKFNYYSAPSGKVFQYFNAGIPIIGNRLQAFSMIETNKAGVLIDNLNPSEIKRALDIIESDYKNMANNSKMLSLKYDNAKYLNKIINYIYYRCIPSNVDIN